METRVYVVASPFACNHQNVSRKLIGICFVWSACPWIGENEYASRYMYLWVSVFPRLPLLGKITLSSPFYNRHCISKQNVMKMKGERFSETNILSQQFRISIFFNLSRFTQKRGQPVNLELTYTASPPSAAYTGREWEGGSVDKILSDSPVSDVGCIRKGSPNGA